MSSHPSALSWQVFTESDIQDARRLIDNLDTSDSTVDTLGFGRVLEAISETFFPATTTLHRKIRYQIFIPALIWALNKRQHTPDARLALKQSEYVLQRALVDSGETDGVIGRNRKEALKYWPSLLYWNATNKLEMFGKETFSMDEVFQIVQENGATLVNDDKEAELQALTNYSKSLNFDKGFTAIAQMLFVEKTGKLRVPVTFELTKVEASYLKNKFQQLFPKSLTCYLLSKQSNTIERITSPFKIASTPLAPLNKLIRQAELFSQFAMGATYAYRWVLCEHLRSRASNKTLERKLATDRDNANSHFSRWQKESQPVLKWSYIDLVDAAAAFDIDLSDPTLFALQRNVLAAASFKGDSKQALQTLKIPIRKHEQQIKRNTSRFENPNISIPKNIYEKAYGGKTLFDYRWERIGKANALAIVSRLEK